MRGSPGSSYGHHKNSGGPPAVVVELMHPVVDLSPVKRALNRRNFLEAERLLEEVLDQAPDSHEAHTLMGVLHECLGQSHAAYHSYRTALECAPSYGPALDNLKRYCERFGLDFHNKAINPSADRTGRELRRTFMNRIRDHLITDRPDFSIPAEDRGKLQLAGHPVANVHFLRMDSTTPRPTAGPLGGGA